MPAHQRYNTRYSGARIKPEGWPVGSFETYAQAQEAVDMLSDNEFPVDDLTIVGVDLMEVESVIGRLTWGRVLASGAASGAWLGLFFGIFLGILTPDFQWVGSIITGVFMGIIFGTVLAAVPYAATRGRRDFVSNTQIVAGRYDVLCKPATAPKARDEITAFVSSKPAGASS
ncbi:MAG: magnesium transporter [Corynebacterium sp.]|nr:magnesium transporter [Corynebacterium sp.]